ncbi:hypothetical protein CJJ19_02685 [Candidatus Williamhamiltonella defendens]|nr:AvrPphF family type III effector [Candidatus Hamiltonella defensa]AYB48574.1 hypothetical protein CJJ19_02685 [Candidatus Hamiltonella defensa]
MLKIINFLFNKSDSCNLLKKDRANCDVLPYKVSNTTDKKIILLKKRDADQCDESYVTAQVLSDHGIHDYENFVAVRVQDDIYTDFEKKQIQGHQEVQAKVSDCYHRKPFLKGIFRGTEKSACLIAKEEDRYALNVMIMTKQAFNEERSNPLNLQKRYAHTNASWVVCRLKTLIDQGCKVYPDTSSHLRSGDGHPFIITLPKTTKTNVEIYPINEESSSKPNKAVLNSPKETDTNKMFSSNRKENEALSSHSTNLNRDLENVDYRQCNVFKIKQTNHENTSEKIWAQETGYINNLKNTGEPALLIHHLDGLFSIEAEGTALNVNDFFEFMRNKYPNLMKKIETDKKPLHLIACYMKDSIAQEIANKLNRTVIIYGDPEKELKSSLKSTTDSYYTFSSLYKKKSQFFNETQVIDTKGVVKIKRSIAKARAIFPKENELEKKLKSPEYQKLVQDRWNRTDMLQKKAKVPRQLILPHSHITIQQVLLLPLFRIAPLIKFFQSKNQHLVLMLKIYVLLF